MAPLIIMIDNYDSFTYNLVQYLGELGANLKVYRNNALTINDLILMKPKALVVSPGPGGPADAGISCDAITFFAGRVPILGVCLGHQCIGAAYGAAIVGAKRLMHGKTSLIYHTGDALFSGIENPFEATRYHSLVIKQGTLSPKFQVIATTHEDNEIMAIRHRTYPLWGVQFHPESILTHEGKGILGNFLGCL